MIKWDFFLNRENCQIQCTILCLIRGTTIEMLTFLEGQALQKRDCPSKIGTVDNYTITQTNYVYCVWL